MKHGYYGFLKKDGDRVTFNDMVHAKLIVVDRTVAVTSSMNVITRSSGGASWEAGIVSMEDTVVESARAPSITRETRVHGTNIILYNVYQPLLRSASQRSAFCSVYAQHRLA
jgi:hypothetical protein